MTTVSDYYKLECDNRALRNIISSIEDLACDLTNSNRTLPYANMIMAVIHKDWKS